MELRSIQYFVQVADEGSITRTADKIGITRKQGIAKVEVRPITLPPPDRDAQR